jgi:hypothetical protein
MTWFVDAHVHHHPCFDWRDQIEGAFAHLARWSERVHETSPPTGVLCFVDLQDRPGLTRLVEEPDGKLPAGCTMESTLEKTAWRVSDPRGASLLLLAGRQIATREGLEVLAISCSEEIPDRLSLAETLTVSLGAAAVTVIPWGFGKWWLGRGATVSSAFTAPRTGRVYLGDNGNRAAIGPEPGLFSTARRRGLPIVSGSDPLPFVSHARRALGYGFCLEGELDSRRPGAELRDALAALDRTPAMVGDRTALPRFVLDQVRMQWQVRRRRTRAHAVAEGAR